MSYSHIKASDLVVIQLVFTTSEAFLSMTRRLTMILETAMTIVRRLNEEELRIWENEMDLADGIFMGGDDPWETFRAINDSVERMMAVTELGQRFRVEQYIMDPPSPYSRNFQHNRKRPILNTRG
ncbi:hypothetical protein TNCV_4316751 [Trichonephila clavipes]|nr:hypothetical protein TNCV_4316751 [Trichonephila clavipes]